MSLITSAPALFPCGGRPCHATRPSAQALLFPPFSSPALFFRRDCKKSRGNKVLQISVIIHKEIRDRSSEAIPFNSGFSKSEILKHAEVSWILKKTVLPCQGFRVARELRVARQDRRVVAPLSVRRFGFTDRLDPPPHSPPSSSSSPFGGEGKARTIISSFFSIL